MGANKTDFNAAWLTGPTPTDFTADNEAGLSIITSAGADIVHDGNGGDTVYVQSATAHIYGGSGADQFKTTAATLASTIDGGTSGHAALYVDGGGAAVMGANITRMNAVWLTGATAANFTANDTAGLSIITSANADTVHAGNGGDVIYVKSGAAHIVGGTGNDSFPVTAATIGASIAGGSGHNLLYVDGGGAMTMGAGITGIAEVHLGGGSFGASGVGFTANATHNLAIYGSQGNDQVNVGDGSQQVYFFGQNGTAVASAANAGVQVKAIGASAEAQLVVHGGGSGTLNDNDSHGLTVYLDSATNLNLGHAGFISVVAQAGGNTLTAVHEYQTMTSTVGGDTMLGYANGHDTFAGSRATLNHDTIGGLTSTDTIHVFDMLPAAGLSYAQAAGHGTLTLGGSSAVTILGTYNAALFHIAADGNGGANVTYG